MKKKGDVFERLFVHYMYASESELAKLFFDDLVNPAYGEGLGEWLAVPRLRA